MTGRIDNLHKAQGIYDEYDRRPRKFSNAAQLRDDVAELQELAIPGVPYFNLQELCKKKNLPWLLHVAPDA